MLSGEKLKKYRTDSGKTVEELAEHLLPAGLEDGERDVQLKTAVSSVKNWERGLYKPRPTSRELSQLAQTLGVEQLDLHVWKASHNHCPMAPRKVRLVADLIRGRHVQDALDVLKFTNKRAAVMVDKVLRSAIANADENEANIERLFVSESRVDEGGVRQGTRRWRPKDRGRAVPFTRLSSHIHVSVDME